MAPISHVGGNGPVAPLDLRLLDVGGTGSPLADVSRIFPSFLIEVMLIGLEHESDEFKFK